MKERFLLWSVATIAFGVAIWMLWDRYALKRQLGRLADSQASLVRASREAQERTDTLRDSQNAIAAALTQTRDLGPGQIASTTAPRVSNNANADEPSLQESQQQYPSTTANPYVKTLDSHFASQNPRSAWPASIRTELENALHKLSAPQRAIQNLECRGDMCRASISFPAQVDAMGFMQQLPQTQNGGYQGAVAANIVTSPDGTANVLFYATLPGMNLPTAEQ